ncbi:MAG TPA: MATE family efflux transporter [Gemmatimonadaceae bacterium]|nr:MATE family efflux transporter [Gemmatimonadaceae bacterium]
MSDPQPAATSSPTAAGAEPLVPPPPPARVRRYDRSIVEGPLLPAVWKIAWPTMLQNVIGGAQGMVDHVMVGHYVGFTGNAAVGVSWQIFLVVITFIMSLFAGMSVLVARFAGADDAEKVDRTIYQALITSTALSFLILAPLGYVLSPWLLELVNAAPEVKAEALPYLRITFVFSGGMMVFFMIGGALRSVGDARTPLKLGVSVTLLNLVLNVILIRGLGPIPAYGTAGAAMGTVIAFTIASAYALFRMRSGAWVIHFPRADNRGLDWQIIRALFRFGLPTGIQGIAMNVGGVLLLAFIGSLAQSAAAQAAYAISYTQLFSMITWTTVGLMSAAAAVAGQNLGAGKPDRASAAVHLSARIGVTIAAVVGALFLLIPRPLLAIFGVDQPAVVDVGVELLRVLSLSGLFIAVALTYTGGLQGTGDTKSPLYISIVSQILVPLGLCFVIQETSTLDPIDIWLAILLGHVTRCILSVLRFNQGKWRHIRVDIGRAAEAK